MYPIMPVLIPTLEFDNYQLTMIDRPSCNYKVWKNDEVIAKVSVGFSCVHANTGTELLLIPYDVSIHVMECTSDAILPLDQMKQIFMSVALFNHRNAKG